MNVFKDMIELTCFPDISQHIKGASLGVSAFQMKQGGCQQNSCPFRDLWFYHAAGTDMKVTV